jgi:hypothetical protein
LVWGKGGRFVLRGGGAVCFGEGDPALVWRGGGGVWAEGALCWGVVSGAVLGEHFEWCGGLFWAFGGQLEAAVLSDDPIKRIPFVYPFVYPN